MAQIIPADPAGALALPAPPAADRPRQIKPLSQPVHKLNRTVDKFLCNILEHRNQGKRAALLQELMHGLSDPVRQAEAEPVLSARDEGNVGAVDVHGDVDIEDCELKQIEIDCCVGEHVLMQGYVVEIWV